MTLYKRSFLISSFALGVLGMLGLALSGQVAHTQDYPQATVSPQWQLPTVEFRDRMLKKAGLAEKVGSWGSMEKDQLYSVARNSSLSELIKDYPALPKSHLKTLSKLAKAAKHDPGPRAEGQPKASPDDVVNKIVNLGP